MARPVQYFRGSANYVNGGTASTSQQVNLGSIPTGYTVTRLRWRWQAQRVINIAAAEAVGVALHVGVILLPATTDPGSVPNAYLNPDADWMSYEVDFFTPYRVENPDGTTFELDIAPGLDYERDDKAMRLATVDSTLWLSAAVDPAYNAQAAFYFSLGGSILVTLPA